MKRLLVSVSVIGIAVGAVDAHAQDTSEGSHTPAGSDEESQGIGNIIVTAQRRTENVQKSSLAISVVSGEDLQRQGVVTARDLSGIAPGVQITQSGASTQTYVRGVGDYSVNGLAQLAISYNIDGVNIDRAPGIATNFYDLERIEVLKGPQGTLYGRNATGGAINLITRKPTNDFGGYVTAEYGNYESKKLAGALNVPLSETLAVRGAFQFTDRDGYLSDGTDDDEQQAGRLQFLWRPSDTVSLRLSGDYAHQGGKGTGSVAWPRQPGTGKWTSSSDPINNAVLSAISGGIGTPIGNNSFLDNKLWNISAELNAELGDFATLTVLPAYRNLNLKQRLYTVGFFAEDYISKSRQTSVEVRLGNQTDTLKWVVGGFYFNLDSNLDFATNPSVLVPFFATRTTLPDVGTKSYAAFGEATLSLTDSLRVIGGIRYTNEKKDYKGTYTDQSVVQAGSLVLSGRASFDAVTWKTGLEFDAGPASMLYLTASKGFKSGGFFTAPAPDNAYNPERLLALSLGSRNRFLDNKLQINIEAFYWRYRDQQVSAVGYTSGSLITLATRNAGSSNPYGADVDIIYKPSPAHTFSANVGYIRAKYKEFKVEYPVLLTGSLVSACDVGTAPHGAAGFETVTVDCSGFPLARTPKWSGSFNYQNVTELNNGGDITLNVGVNFASSRYLSVEFFTPYTRDNGYALGNADLTYNAPGHSWSVTGFVKNITNEEVYQGAQNSLFNGNYSFRTIGAPRTYGVKAIVNF